MAMQHAVEVFKLPQTSLFNDYSTVVAVVQLTLNLLIYLQHSVTVFKLTPPLRYQSFNSYSTAVAVVQLTQSSLFIDCGTAVAIFYL